MYSKQPDRGCKMITIPAEQLSSFAYNDYTKTKKFLDGVVAHHLCMAIVRKTVQDFGDTCDLRNLICMEDFDCNKLVQAGLAAYTYGPEGYEHFFRTNVLTEELLFNKAFVNAENKETVNSAVAFTDAYEGMCFHVEMFFNELINRVTGKFSKYEDKKVLVSVGFVTPSLITVSYKTVLDTPALMMRYS